MHEIGMCEAVVATVEQRAAGRPVAAVGVRVGLALRVVPDAFNQAFELVAGGTVADGARVDLVQVPGQGACRACAATFETVDRLARCPTCGAGTVDVDESDELTLEWLRYRSAEPTAPPGPAAAEPGGG